MLERGPGQIRLLLLIPIKLPDAITLLIGGVTAFLLAFLLTFFVKAFCYKVGWLDKPAARKVDFRADYVGFSIDPQFVIGYGLDYAERYRNLPEIQVLSD